MADVARHGPTSPDADKYYESSSSVRLRRVDIGDCDRSHEKQADREGWPSRRRVGRVVNLVVCLESARELFSRQGFVCDEHP